MAETSTKDKYDLRIRIIGAGMGGLTAALALARAGFKDIQVFEMAPDLGFVGAGIQLAPNMARILDRLDVWEDVRRDAVSVTETSIIDAEEDRELALVNLSSVKQLYGYEHMVGHRSSLARALFTGCQRHAPAVKFHFNTRASDISVSPARFTATPTSGPAYPVAADVLLAADGIKSGARAALLATHGAAAAVHDTGQASYRIVLSRAQLAHDPPLLSLLDAPRVTRWVGAGRHIIAYPVARHSLYNISTAHPDSRFAAAPSASYTTRADKAAMLDEFGAFCPRARRLLALAPEERLCEWRLRAHLPLPTWTTAHAHDGAEGGGLAALLGDAAHPSLPHLAQGAAQAVEDGAVLGVALARMPDGRGASVAAALRVYEGVRKARADGLVALAAANGAAMQLGKGAAREARDALFRAAAESGSVPDRWADRDVQREIYGHDCVAVAEEACAREFGVEGQGGFVG